jgi:hypothetical protein
VEELGKRQAEQSCPFCEALVAVPLAGKHMRAAHPEHEHTCLDCRQEQGGRAALEQHVQAGAGRGQEVYVSVSISCSRGSRF